MMFEYRFIEVETTHRTTYDERRGSKCFSDDARSKTRVLNTWFGEEGLGLELKQECIEHPQDFVLAQDIEYLLQRRKREAESPWETIATF